MIPLTPHDITNIQLEASKFTADGKVPISREVLDELLYNYIPETTRLRAELTLLKQENAKLRAGASNTRIYD